MNVTKTDQARGTEMVVCIAGINVGIRFDRDLSSVGLDPAYDRFITDGQNKPDLTIDCSFTQDPIPLEKDFTKIFDSQCLWSLHERDGEFLYLLDTVNAPGNPYRKALFDRDFSRGSILSTEYGRGTNQAGKLPDPLEYPLGEALTVNLLSRGEGIMIHSCGVDDDGRGYLLAGHSGAGKTTIARQLVKSKSVSVLNDDRMAVVNRNGEPRMYGTPWHGDHPGVDPRGVPIAGIFFLKQAKENKLQALGAAAASAKLVSHSFPPVWSRDGMQFTLEFLDKLVSKVPCHKLEFVKPWGESELLELLRCA